VSQLLGANSRMNGAPASTSQDPNAAADRRFIIFRRPGGPREVSDACAGQPLTQCNRFKVNPESHVTFDVRSVRIQ
jgi:hypothetical protein